MEEFLRDYAGRLDLMGCGLLFTLKASSKEKVERSSNVTVALVGSSDLCLLTSSHVEKRRERHQTSSPDCQAVQEVLRPGNLLGTWLSYLPLW